MLNIFKRVAEKAELHKLQQQDKFKQIVSEIRAIEDYISTNRFSAVFNGNHLLFEPINKEDVHCRISLAYMRSDILGGHSFKNMEIMLNAELLKSEEQMTPNALHEFTHAVEHALSKCEHMYDKDSKEYKCVVALKSNFSDIEERTDVFGIPVGGRAYTMPTIEANNIRSDATDMAFALYRLAPIERFACAVERERYAGENPPNNKRIAEMDQSLRSAISTIEIRYKLQNTSYDEICRAVDDAYYSLQSNKIPSTDLSAALMYDIAATIAIQQDKIDIKHFNHATNYFEMTKTLANNGFVMPGSGAKKYDQYVVINDKPIGLCDERVLQQMSASEQRNNPMLIANAVLLRGERAVECIIDKEAFAAWYYSNDNLMPEQFMNQIATHMGEEFSYHNYLEINASRYSDDLGDIFVEAHDVQNTCVEEQFNSDKFEYPDFSNR